MLDRILQGLHEVEGVQATLVVESGGALLAARAHAIYDEALLGQVARSIVNAIDSVQLVQDDWELVTGTFADGKVLIRNLSSRNGRSVALAVVADQRLNPSFAGVAIRVAAQKLKTALETPGAFTAAPAPASAPPVAAPSYPPPQPVAPPAQPVYAQPPHASNPYGMQPPLVASASMPPSVPQATSGMRSASPSAIPPQRVDLSGSGLSWSGTSKAAGTSQSGVAVLDAPAATYLSACTKALSHSVGPMAKVFIKEAVRRLCPDRPFAREDGPALLGELETHINDPAERADFRRALKSL